MERQLESAIVYNIVKMLGKLGSDFAFMGRQFRLELDDKEYLIDLLFYHRKLKCMVAIELKTTDFKPEHRQQLNLICKTKSNLTVEYALELVNHPVGVATYSYYQLPESIAKYLPNEDELTRILSDEKDI